MGFNDFWINNNGKKEHLNNAKHGVRKEQVDKKFHNLFDAYDANGDGTLETEELGGVFKGLTKFAGADKTLDAAENKQVASLFANQAGIEDADFMGFVRSVSKATEDIVDSKEIPTPDGGREVTTTYKDGSVETISYYPDGEYKFKKLDQKATTTTTFYTVGDNLNKKYTAAEIESRVKKAYNQRVAQVKASAEKNKPVEGKATYIIPNYDLFKQEYMQRNKIYQGSHTHNFERHDFELSERGKQDVAVRDFVLSHYIDTHKAAQEALESMGILDDVGAAINAGAGELWNSIKNVWNGTEEEYQNFYELSKKFEPNYNKALRESGSLDVMRNNPEMFFRGFETDFKKDMGHKYNLENSVQFQQTAEQYQNAQILKQRIDILNKAMQEVRMYQSEQDALVYAPAQNEGLNPASHIVSANKLLLQYFNNDQEAVDMILNGTIGNADATIKAISGIKEDTEKLNKAVLDGKTFDQIQEDYKSQYKAMYGTDFVPDELTEKVMDAKATGGMVKLAAITIVSILITKSPIMAEISAAAGGAEVSGAAANMIRTLATKYGPEVVQQGIKLAMTSGTLATDVGLTLINQATSERGVNGEELWESTKGSAKYIFFGAYVGAPLAQAVSKSLGKIGATARLFEGGVKTGEGAIQTTSITGDKLLQNFMKGGNTALTKGGAFLTEVGAFAGLDVATEDVNITDALAQQGSFLPKLKVMNHVLEYMLGAKAHTATSRANLNAAIEKSGVKNWNIKEIKTPQKTQYVVDIDGLPVGKFEDANQLATAMLERVTANYSESAKPQTRTQITKPEGEVKTNPEIEVETETAKSQGIERETRTTDVQTDLLGQRKIIGDGDNDAAYRELESLVGTKESPLEENHSTSQFNGVQNFNVQNYRKKLSEMKAVQDESMELKPRFTAEEINSLVELKQKYGDIVDRYINQTISANGMEFPIYRTAKEVAQMVELSKAHKMLTSSLSKLTVKTVDDTGKEVEVPRFNSDNIETIIKAWEKNSKLTNELLKNISTPDNDRYLPLQHPNEILNIVEANEINPTLTRELMQIKDEHYIGEDGTIHINLSEQEKALVEKGEHPENLQKISQQKFYGDQIKLLVILNKSNPKITELFKSEHSGNAVQDFSDAYLENRSFIDKLLDEKEQLGVGGLDDSYYVTELAKYRKNSPELVDELLHRTFTLGGETHKMPVAHIIDILKVTNKDNVDVINKALEGYTYRRGLHEQQESRFFADDIVKIAKATTKENKDIVLKALEKRAVYNEIDGYEYNEQHKLSAKTKEVETFAYGADDIVNLARMSEINKEEVLKELGGDNKPVIENWNNDSLKYTDTKEIFIRTLEKQFGEDSDFVALAKESLNNQYFGNDNFKAILDLIDGGDIDVQAQNVHRYICQNVEDANYDRETGYPLHEIPQELRKIVFRNAPDSKYDRVTGVNIDEKITEFLQNQRAEQQNIPLSERLVQYKSKIENKLLEDKIQNIIEQFKDDSEFQSDLKDLYTSITDTKGLYKLIHTYDDIKFDRTTGEKISHSEKLRLFKAQIIQDNKLAPSEGVTRFSKDDQVTLKQYNKKDVEQLANEKIRDILGDEDYKYDGKQIAELLKIKATDENLYNLLNTLQCVDADGDPYFPYSHENLALIHSIAKQDKGGAALARFISKEVLTKDNIRQQKYNKYELEKINDLLSTYPPKVIYRGLSRYNLEVQDLNKYCEALKNYDENLVDKLLLVGFNIDHSSAILQGYDKNFVNNMVSGISKVRLSNKLESTKLKISEDQKGVIIGDDIHIRVEDENGNIYKVDKTTGEVTSLNIGNKTINLKTGETTEVKIVTDEKLNPISKDGTSVYEDVPEYIEVYRSADGKEISHEKLRESKVPGNYEIYSYRKGADGKITKDLIGLSEYDGDGGVHIEKNVESLNGTKTQTVYADDVQGNRLSYYRVTDANGKVLYENTEKFKKISDDHYQTFTNGQGYDIQYFDDRVVITKLDKNNKPTKEKIEYTIKDFTEEEYKKFYDELNSKAEEAGEAINNVTQDIIRTKKDLGKVDIDAILKDQNIQEHTIDRSLIPTLKDLSGEDYFNLFGQTKILVGELSESGNAYSINGGIAVSKEQYEKLSTLLHEAGHEHTARLNLVEDKELNEIYEREKAAFVNTFPDEAIETLEYFLANNEVFVQNKNNDLIRVKGMKGLDETTAESKLITKYKPQWELTQARTAMLQQYFPETIACIGRKNSANIPTPEVKSQGSQTIKRMVNPIDVQSDTLK